MDSNPEEKLKNLIKFWGQFLHTLMGKVKDVNSILIKGLKSAVARLFPYETNFYFYQSTHKFKRLT